MYARSTATNVSLRSPAASGGSGWEHRWWRVSRKESSQAALMGPSVAPMRSSLASLSRNTSVSRPVSGAGTPGPRASTRYDLTICITSMSTAGSVRRAVMREMSMRRCSFRRSGSRPHPVTTMGATSRSPCTITHTSVPYSGCHAASPSALSVVRSRWGSCQMMGGCPRAWLLVNRYSALTSALTHVSSTYLGTGSGTFIRASMMRMVDARRMRSPGVSCCDASVARARAFCTAELISASRSAAGLGICGAPGVKAL
mmetsp:Transcript_12124/g.36401  ORF Transcript_12124/g.36401 Transcript_12124/m.36401 type:complete len:257 (-) Transcript_12124:717-1487(-)